MRLDRFLTLNVIHPGRRVFNWPAGFASGHSSPTTWIPILMYHSISEDAEPGVHPYHQTNTSPAVFRSQMRYLAENGYGTISLGEAIKLLDGETPGATGDGGNRAKRHRSVIITFDDGFRDFYTQAFPTLQEFGFTATMFLPTGFIGDERRLYVPKVRAQSVRLKSVGRECLTWKEVRALRKFGIEMGSHTVNHPRLVELTSREIELEIRNSKSEIEARIGEPVTTFAYPYAFPQANRSFSDSFRNSLVSAGYDCNVTTEVGRMKHGDDLYRLKRLPVNSLDDLRLFQAKLEGGYDWLSIPQLMSKTIRQWTNNSTRNPFRMPLPA